MKIAYSPQQLKSRVGTWFSPCVWRCVCRNISQMRSYSSRADMGNRIYERDGGRCTFGIVAGPRLRPMASWVPEAQREGHGPGFRLREAAGRRVHRLLDSGPPLSGHLLQRRSTGTSGRALRAVLRLPRLAPVHPADEAKATGAPGGRAADGRSLAIFLPVWRAQRPFLPLPAVLLLFLEPRKQSRRRTERPELEDDLAMFLVLREEEHPPALRNHIDCLLERNLVIPFPFLAAREIEPFHVEEQDSSPRLPHPSFSLLDERLLCEGHGFEYDVLEGAVPDDLVAAVEDGLVRLGKDNAHLPHLVDLHPSRQPRGQDKLNEPARPHSLRELVEADPRINFPRDVGRHRASDLGRFAGVAENPHELHVCCLRRHVFRANHPGLHQVAAGV